VSEPPDDPDLRAAEYVLGTLPADERARIARERRTDPAVEAAVRAWERRLGPLSLVVPEVAPGPWVWHGIARSLRGPVAATGEPVIAANDNRLAALTRSVRRWRLATAGAGLAAAALALIVASGPLLRRAEPSRYVAVVQSGGALPALIVSVDVAGGTAQVRPVAARAPEGRSLELWYVGAGQAPRALGLVGGEATRLALPAGAGADGVLAVSVEPPGGSPTGQPTGQVLYTGTLIRE